MTTLGCQASIVSAIGSTTPSVFLYALDLIELSGDDLRREPLQVRKATLASVLAKAASGLRFQPAGETRLVRGVPQCSPTLARWAWRSCVEAQELDVPIGAVPRLAQNEEPGEPGRAADLRMEGGEEDWAEGQRYYRISPSKPMNQRIDVGSDLRAG